MRRRRYLDFILTANAVLLAALVWTQVAERPLLAEPAVGQSSPRVGVPNAAEQRQRMIDALEKVQRSVEASRKLLEGGQVRVQVSNLSELRASAGGE